MRANVTLSALEEDILYILYDNYLLKRAIASVDHITVLFDTRKGELFPWQFSLVMTTNQNQPLILEQNGFDAFIQTFQTYKRMETEHDDWPFLDALLGELKEEMPHYLARMAEAIQKRAEELWEAQAFLPEKIEGSLRDDTMKAHYNQEDAASFWSNAWVRFAEGKKTYFSYLGFTKEKWEAVKGLSIRSFQETKTVFGTEVTMQVQWKESRHVFSWIKDETHMCVDGHWTLDEGDYYPTGMPLGEFLGIEKTSGYDFEKMIWHFLNEQPALYDEALRLFQTTREKLKNEAVKQKIGLSVAEAYVKEDRTVIVLEDGSVFTCKEKNED